MKILITDGTSYKSAVIAKFIKENYKDTETHVLVYKKAGKIFHTRYADNVHYADNAQNGVFLNLLKDYIKLNGIDIIIPVNSSEIDFFITNKELLYPCLDYIGTLESYMLLHNKNKFSAFCNSIGVPVPKTLDKTEDDDNLEDCKIVVKPILSSSAKNVKYYDSFKDFKREENYFKKDEYIIQEYIAGRGAGISLFSVNGEIKVLYAHNRVLEYPACGGSSTMREPLKSEFLDAMINDARKIIKASNWSGFCMLELRYNDKKYAFIEANPRIWGSIGQGLNSGINYFQPLLGKTVKELKKKEAITILSPLYLLSFICKLFKGKIDLIAFVKKRIQAVPDVSLFKDPLGYIGQFIR